MSTTYVDGREHVGDRLDGERRQFVIHVVSVVVLQLLGAL